MNPLQRALRQAKITPSQLSEHLNIAVRQIRYQYNTGRMSFALIYKIHKLTGIPISQIVPPYLADEWVALMNEQYKTHVGKPRPWAPPKPEPDVPHETIPEPLPEEKMDVGFTAKKKKSIAEIMKDAPQKPKIVPLPETSGPDPDFTGIDDSLFQTSADQNAGRKKK